MPRELDSRLRGNDTRDLASAEYRFHFIETRPRSIQAVTLVGST